MRQLDCVAPTRLPELPYDDTRIENPILLYYDPFFLKHDTGNHPENAMRLTPVMKYLDTLATRENIIRPTWESASANELQLVHSESHISSVREMASEGGGFVDQDTYISPASYDVALYAVGAVCDAVKRIDHHEDNQAFCLVRPPGHHAAANRIAGFCLFNNVAVAARFAVKKLSYQRVLIVDWDVHHGDGTQAIFWEDPSVAYFSIHRESIYPYTGLSSELGSGTGLGTIKNLPIRFGMSPDQQVEQFTKQLNLFAEKIQPEIVFISAGFDAHRDDPIGSLGLDAADFASMTHVVLEIANQYAGGKIVSVLEGGYNPEALAACTEQHLNVLLGA